MVPQPLKVAAIGNLQGRMENLQWLSQFGFAAVAAGAVFWIYRTDRRHSEKRWEALASNFKEIVQANTEALTRLSEHIK